MTEQQREAFEKWAESEGLNTVWGHTGYLLADTAAAWKAWQAALSHAERREFQTEQDLINFLDGLHETAGPDSSALTGQKWAPAQRAIEGIRSRAEGEAVTFMRTWKSEPIYTCNKPGDMGGTYYPAPQVAGLTETAIKSSPAYRALHREKEHLLGLLKDQAPQVAVPEGFREKLEDLVAAAFYTSDMTSDKCKAGIEELMAMLAAAPTAPAGELRPDCSVCGDFGSDCGVCGAPSRQLVSDPDGLPGAKGYWLKDSGYGVDDHFDTLDEALSSASSLIEDYRTEAGADEWPSDADSITISAVTHVARFVHVRDNEYDLRMEAAAPAPDEREIAALALERHADNLIVMAERDGRNSDRESQQTWEEAAYFAKQEAARLRAGKEGE